LPVDVHFFNQRLLLIYSFKQRILFQEFLAVKLIQIVKPGLFGKMLISIGLAAAVPLAAVILITRYESYKIVSQESFRYTAELGDHYANQINMQLTAHLGETRAIAALFEDYQNIKASQRRNIFSSQLRSVLERNPDILAVWTQWEPGAIGDDPSDYKGTKLTAPNGAFNATWYRDKDIITQGMVTNEAYQDDYYVIPRTRMKESLILPYRYTYTGKKEDSILETSICVPIIHKNIFKGVVGFDIPTSNYQKIIETIKVFKTGYAILVANNGMRVAHPNSEKIGDIIGDDLTPEKQKETLENIRRGVRFYVDKNVIETGQYSRQFFTPISIGNTGTPWYIVLTVPFDDITESADNLVFSIIIIGGIAMILLCTAIFFTARKFTHPIIALTGYTEQIASGNLSVHIDSTDNDEIGALTRSFNAMAEKVKNSRDRYDETNTLLKKRNDDLLQAEKSLREFNSELEMKVSERTIELTDAVDSLEKTNIQLQLYIEKLNSAQDQIVFSEKMAVLGQLVASIAHELNTPLGAIRSSASFIATIDNELYPLISEFYVSLSDNDRTFFSNLLKRGRETASQLSFPESRILKRALVKRFERENFSNPDFLADEVETLGIFDLEEEIVSLISRGQTNVLSHAAKYCSIYRALTIILNASDKAAGTVAALGNYSRNEDRENTQLVYPVKEIETILILYYNKIKHGLILEKKYHCEEPVYGYRDKLNQIWINLINNALFAMDYTGKLEIQTNRHDEWVVVSFTDNGTGIPDTIKEKVFQPFFSTKKPGDGTGLGLDICQKIANLHGGRIEFESCPGRTCFKVFLKAAIPEQQRDNT
jgi:signal transduction histidine kinase